MFDLEEVIRERRSVRMFLRDKPVPRHLVDEALDLAIHAPSNSNVQPWQVVFASGPARDRLVEALLEEANARPPVVPQLPPGFAHLRTELGGLVYGSMGIARHDAEARRIAVLRNWEFFRAPRAGVVCMHRDLDFVDGMGVGMFLQTLLLALTSRGLGTLAARDPRGDACAVRAGGRLPRPRVPGQQAAGATQPGRRQRTFRRQLTISLRCRGCRCVGCGAGWCT